MPVCVDDQGVWVPSDLVGAIDVLFDGVRVWSFDPCRDAVTRHKQRMIPWPKLLIPFLDGTTEVEMRQLATGDARFRAEVAFGTSPKRIRLADEHGNPVGIDKTGRVERTFAQTDTVTRQAVVDALQQVLTDLREVAGLDAFLAFGCLLGAAREGQLIGHDTDTDLAFLSRYDHPYDVIRESRLAERAMRRRGWKIVRMSAGDFKVWVELDDGQRCGVDIFATFYIDGIYHMVPARRGPLDRSVIDPLGTITLEGREFLAPRDVDAYLEFTYGPDWRIPDPSYRAPDNREIRRRYDAWLRGPRDRLRYWQEFYQLDAADQIPDEPSSFARWVDDQIDTGARIMDVGTGTGRDAVWFAARGHDVVAVDFSPIALGRTRARAAADGVQIRARQLNLNVPRSILVEGARLAHQREPRHLYGRLLLDSINHDARQRFWRMASMGQRRGGLTFLEFRTQRSSREPTHFPRHQRMYLRPERVLDEITGSGGTVVVQDRGRGLATLGDEDPDVCRLAVRWRS